MRNSLLITAAAAALIAGTGIVAAQDKGMSGSSAPGTSQAPAANSDSSTGPSGSEMKGRKGNEVQQKTMPSDRGAQRAQEPSSGKAASDTQRSRDGMKGEKNEQNANENRGTMDRNATDNRSMDKAGTTTGQAGAAAKLSTEQRTTVRAAIDKQHVRNITNVNFSISVGTRVPRTVTFHPLPVELVTYYPSWRGYEYILVNDQIIVVNPRTLEIVAILEV